MGVDKDPRWRKTPSLRPTGLQTPWRREKRVDEGTMREESVSVSV